MKNFVVTTVFALAISLAAVAQTTPGTAQPSATTRSTQPQTSPSQSSDMSNSGSQTPIGEKKGEKTLKGCLQSSGGQFTLEDKHGKQVALTGSKDFASHVGHTVAVHGTFGIGSDASSGASATSATGSMSASGDQFMVSKLDMVSEKCSTAKSKNTSKDVTNDSGKPSPNRN